jgi:hypothetical protein
MKTKINYTEGEIGEIEIVKDFLPSPSELAKQHGGRMVRKRTHAAIVAA